MIRITDSIGIEERELDERFVRASGPGGQNVNKVSTAVELRFDVAASSLPERCEAAVDRAGRQPHDRRRRSSDRQPRAPHPGDESRGRSGASGRLASARRQAPEDPARDEAEARCQREAVGNQAPAQRGQVAPRPRPPRHRLRREPQRPQRTQRKRREDVFSHSHRSASVGLMCDARRAGTYAASTVTANTTDATSGTAT